MHFSKMQGTGNDYIYLNGFEEKIENPEILARRMSDRHFGIGSDGLVIIGPGEQADFSMRMYNSDGSVGKMCGNAARCVGKYVYEKGLTRKTEIVLSTDSGIRTLYLKIRNDKVESVRVDMGVPVFDPELIPLTSLYRTNKIPLELMGNPLIGYAVSMGNPHLVIFCNSIFNLDLQRIGIQLEHHPAFPDGVNTEFVEIADRQNLRMRVWERGSGETLACGTGACAVLAAAVSQHLTERKVTMSLLGGQIQLCWREDNGHIEQEGPASFVYEGEWPSEGE